MNTYKTNFVSIKEWAEEDRPREKLQAQGRQYLTDAELLAILLGSGSRSETAVGLSLRILQAVDNNLHELGKQSIGALMQYKGIGAAKAITIAAAMELGRRRQGAAVKTKTKITCSGDAYEILAPMLADLPHEEFWLLLLNRSNGVICREKISRGGIAGTVVDARIIFKKALEHLACAMVLCHNHPSGNLNPSQADIEVTRKLKKAGASLDITVIDHLIITDNAYFSFADEAML